jgi:structural maintenance of chromosome 1
MPVSRLELENFKSYAGTQHIGPFSVFTSVIGPNGSGKSNLMDSISFVLGVQSRELRSSQLKDLIFRPPGSGKSTPKNIRCSATLVYENEDGTEIRFSRSISPAGVGDYKVDGKVMSRADYEKELAEIGVLVKARNFLVFQGDVESLARKSPTELVDLLETISGSADYKEAYDAAIAEKEEAEQARLFATKQKKSLEIERKQLKEQKDEAERFHALLEERAEVSTELYLWQLYHLDQDRIERESAMKELSSDLEAAAETEAEAAQALKMTKKAVSEARRETATAEKHRVQLAAVCDQLEPSIIQTAEEIKSLTKKLALDEKQLEKSKTEEAMHADKLAKLKDDINEYKQTEIDLTKDFEEAKSKLIESAGEGVVQLTAAQEDEYEEVKEAAAAAGAEPRRILAALQRKLDSARVAVGTATTEYEEATQLHSKIQRDLQDMTNRRETVTKVRLCQVFCQKRCSF